MDGAAAVRPQVAAPAATQAVTARHAGSARRSPRRRSEPIGKPLLEVSGLSKSFGGLKAVQSVSFSVPEGSILGIIGPNGAGKTTLFNLLERHPAGRRGHRHVRGPQLRGLTPNQIASSASAARSRWCARSCA